VAELLVDAVVYGTAMILSTVQEEENCIYMFKINNTKLSRNIYRYRKNLLVKLKKKLQ